MTQQPYNDDFNLQIGKGIYRDTGCDLAPACLACPLPKCRYDVQGGGVAIRFSRLEATRNHYIRSGTINGMSV